MTVDTFDVDAKTKITLWTSNQSQLHLILNKIPPKEIISLYFVEICRKQQ